MRVEVVDLTPVYLRYAPRGRWRDYEASYPALFRHYHRYWADAGAAYALRSAAVIRERAALIRSRLPAIGRALTARGFADGMSCGCPWKVTRPRSRSMSSERTN